jgi:hypothetical protein
VGIRLRFGGLMEGAQALLQETLFASVQTGAGVAVMACGQGAGVAVVACGSHAHNGTMVEASTGVPGVPSLTVRTIRLGVAFTGVLTVVAMTFAAPRIGVTLRKPCVGVRALVGGEQKPATRGDCEIVTL